MLSATVVGLRAYLALLGVLGALLMFGACGDDRDAASVLRQAADRSDGDRYVMIERPDAAGLAACTTGESELVAEIDRASRVVAVGRTGDLEPTVVWTDERTYLRYVHSDDEEVWVAQDRSMDAESGDLVAAMVGPGLARYALAGDLPASPAATARSALQFRSGASFASEAGRDRVIEIEIDRRAVAKADPANGAIETGEVAFPRLRFVIRDGVIIEIGAREGTGEHASLGWRWLFDWAVTKEVPAPVAALDWENVREQVRGGRVNPPPPCSIG